jgi:hypothetical protein
VIGIPTLAATSPQGGTQAQGIGFAIPSNLARDIARQIIDSGHVTNSHRAALGAQVTTVTGPDGTPGGAGIAAVADGGPADRGRAAARPAWPRRPAQATRPLRSARLTRASRPGWAVWAPRPGCAVRLVQAPGRPAAGRNQWQGRNALRDRG